MGVSVVAVLFMGARAVAVLTVYGSQSCGCPDFMGVSAVAVLTLWESALWLY